LSAAATYSASFATDGPAFLIHWPMMSAAAASFMPRRRTMIALSSVVGELRGSQRFVRCAPNSLMI
jgi:hypothetical protein